MDIRLNPLLEQAKNGEIELFFGDGVHLIYGAELGYCWCKTRQEVKSAYGRKRFNVMGAYNPITHKTTVVSNDSYLTSSEIVELYHKLREENENKKIVIILDNAKYQKCDLTKNAAEECNIEVIYLPSYSPNLNLIERLWKLLRKECMCNKYKETFIKFCEDILDFLSQTSTKYLEKVKSLLTPNFQVLGD